MFDHTSSFVVFLPYSRFTFTHHEQPIIEEVDSNFEIAANPDALVVKVYNPPPSREYV